MVKNRIISGLAKGVTRGNLAKANGKRDYRIFEGFAHHMISLANSMDQVLGRKAYAFDSTTIDLCPSVFWWARFLFLYLLPQPA